MKKMIITCMASIIMLTGTPLAVNAQSSMPRDNYIVPQIEEDIVNITRSAPESDGFCHCGARREKVRYLSMRTGHCPIHGVESGCIFKSERYYCYCTNPNCGDDWYTAWKEYEVEHVE